MTTPIDRESVERLARRNETRCQVTRRALYTLSEPEPLGVATADTLRALRAALDAAEAENKRLRGALTEIDNLSPGLSTPSEYARGWNEGRWRAKNTARAALQENPDG